MTQEDINLYLDNYISINKLLDATSTDIKLSVLATIDQELFFRDSDFIDEETKLLSSLYNLNDYNFNLIDYPIDYIEIYNKFTFDFKRSIKINNIKNSFKIKKFEDFLENTNALNINKLLQFYYRQDELYPDKKHIEFINRLSKLLEKKLRKEKVIKIKNNLDN